MIIFLKKFLCWENGVLHGVTFVGSDKGAVALGGGAVACVIGCGL